MDFKTRLALWLAPHRALPWGNPDDAPSDRRQLGAAAERLLNDSVLALAFERVENRLAKDWQESRLCDRDIREEAYHLHWALAQVRLELQKMLGNAKVLRAEADRKAADEKHRAARREREALG